MRGAWRKHGLEGAESSTGPGSLSSCRRPRARTISASSDAIAGLRARSPRRQGSGTSTSGAERARAVRCRTSRAAVRRGLTALYRIQRKVRPRMLVNAKWRRNYIKDRSGENADGAAESSDQTYSGGGRRVPAGTHYMGDTATAMSPPPVLPVFAGTFAGSSSSRTLESSELFAGNSRRTSLGGAMRGSAR